MKRLILWGTFAFVLAASPVFAQVPLTMGYQGVLTDNTGAIPVDGAYNFTFSIYDDPALSGAHLLWTENQSNIAVTRGGFSVILGMGTPPVPLAIPFDKQYYLGIQVALAPGAPGVELSPRTILAASPYSLNGRSGMSGSGTLNQIPKFSGSTSLANSNIFDNGTSVGIGTTSPSGLLDLNKASGQASMKLRSGSLSGSLIQLQRYNGGGSVFNIETGANATDNFAIHHGSPFNDFVIVPSGNVGIGIANPGSTLDVNGNTSIRGNLGFFRPGVSDIRFDTQGPGYPNNTITIFSATTGTRHDMMTVDEQGNVTATGNLGGVTAVLRAPPTIGLCTGLQPLFWDPTTKQVCFGSPCATSPRDSAPQSISAGSASAATRAVDIGTVPEEVQQSVRDLVQVDKHDNSSAIDYDKLPLYLLEVVKSQQKTIQELRAALDHLQSR